VHSVYGGSDGFSLEKYEGLGSRVYVRSVDDRFSAVFVQIGRKTRDRRTTVLKQSTPSDILNSKQYRMQAYPVFFYNNANVPVCCLYAFLTSPLKLKLNQRPRFITHESTSDLFLNYVPVYCILEKINQLLEIFCLHLNQWI
jgi:hypothetical protein